LPNFIQRFVEIKKQIRAVIQLRGSVFFVLKEPGPLNGYFYLNNENFKERSQLSSLKTHHFSGHRKESP